MRRFLSNRVLYGVVVAGLCAYAAAGWFILVGGKHADTAALKEEVAAVDAALVVAKAALERQDDVEPILVADIFRLATAMPSVPDMPGIVLELSRIAQETGIEFNSITPQPPIDIGLYQTVPIALIFDGNFYELSDFLFRIRTLVGVRQSALQATGRLFAVDAIDFAQGGEGFPQITAHLTVNAYVFGAPAATVPATAPAGTEGAPAAATPAAPATPTPELSGVEAAGATP